VSEQNNPVEDEPTPAKRSLVRWRYYLPLVLGGLVMVAQTCLIRGHNFERHWTGKTVLICQRCGRQVEP
jgi:hypothetical protein